MHALLICTHAFVCTKAWEACMDKVVLTVMVTNTAARGLYEALGYTTDKVR